MTNTYVAQQPGQLMKNIQHTVSSNELTACLWTTSTCATVLCDIPGSHGLVTRNLESSFSLPLEAPHVFEVPHGSIRRGYRDIRVDTGQTFLATVIERRGDQEAGIEQN